MNPDLYLFINKVVAGITALKAVIFLALFLLPTPPEFKETKSIGEKFQLLTNNDKISNPSKNLRQLRFLILVFLSLLVLSIFINLGVSIKVLIFPDTNW